MKKSMSAAARLYSAPPTPTTYTSGGQRSGAVSSSRGEDVYTTNQQKNIILKMDTSEDPALTKMTSSTSPGALISSRVAFPHDQRGATTAKRNGAPKNNPDLLSHDTSTKNYVFKQRSSPQPPHNYNHKNSSRPKNIKKSSSREDDKSNVDESELITLNGTAETMLDRVFRNDSDLIALDVSNMVFTNKFFNKLVMELKHNSNLRELYLNNCQIGDDTLRKILNCCVPGQKGNVCSIQVLSLEDNMIRNVGCVYIARAMGNAAVSKYGRQHGGLKAVNHGPAPQRLRSISLRGNALRGVEGAKVLAQALIQQDMNLQNLNLAANAIDAYGAGWLALAIRNNNVLRSLDLRGNTEIGVDGVHELTLACETANANLILCGGEEFVVRVCGRRNVSVYVDGDYEFAETDWDRMDAVFKKPGSLARKPISLMKRNYSLGIFEPVSIMADRSAVKNSYRPADSRISGNYVRLTNPARDIFRKVPETEVHSNLGHENRSGVEKEACLSYGKTRLRYKPGPAYFYPSSSSSTSGTTSTTPRAAHNYQRRSQSAGRIISAGRPPATTSRFNSTRGRGINHDGGEFYLRDPNSNSSSGGTSWHKNHKNMSSKRSFEDSEGQNYFHSARGGGGRHLHLHQDESGDRDDMNNFYEDDIIDDDINPTNYSDCYINTGHDDSASSPTTTRGGGREDFNIYPAYDGVDTSCTTPGAGEQVQYGFFGGDMKAKYYVNAETSAINIDEGFHNYYLENHNRHDNYLHNDLHVDEQYDDHAHPHHNNSNYIIDPVSSADDAFYYDRYHSGPRSPHL